MKRIVILLSILLVINLTADNIQDKLEKFGIENGKGYIRPLVTAFGTNLNSGLYNTAKVLKPFFFGIMFNANMTYFPPEAEIFRATRPELYIPNTDIPIFAEEEIETATVFGKEGQYFTLNDELSDYPDFEDQIHDIYTSNGLKLPNGAQNTTEIPFAPLVIPQINLGLPKGNELMFRYLPTYEFDKKLGALSFWGIGLKHSIDQYFPSIIPIDIATQIAFQQFKITDIMDISTFAANAQISKKLSMFTFYGGLGFESAKLTAKYETEITLIDTSGNAVTQPLNIDFDIESENDFRATFGIRYSILVMKFFADYSLCKYPVANLGFGLSF
ncbi:MAG: hypothetical protein H8E57_03850 [Candidatus Cloacimonetes bacterium]|nr:hypothetical protein [Candidatus Cloacimonadota bacterium]